MPLKNKVKRKAYAKEYGKKHRTTSTYKAGHKICKRNYIATFKGHSKTIYGQYLRNDTRLGRQCGTYEELIPIMKNPCIYCGTYYFRVADVEYNGLDRIDSNIGHTKDNCEPCCYTCNRMKSDMTKEEFLGHIEQILNKEL